MTQNLRSLLLKVVEFVTHQVTGLGSRSQQLSQIRISSVILFLFQSKPFTICVLFSSFDSEKTHVISSFYIKKVNLLGRLSRSLHDSESETGTSCGDWGGLRLSISETNLELEGTTKGLF